MPASSASSSSILRHALTLPFSMPLLSAQPTVYFNASPVIHQGPPWGCFVQRPKPLQSSPRRGVYDETRKMANIRVITPGPPTPLPTQGHRAVLSPEPPDPPRPPRRLFALLCACLRGLRDDLHLPRGPGYALGAAALL